MKNRGVLTELPQQDTKMKPEKIIAITMSDELQKLKLSELSGRMAKYVKEVKSESGKELGAWVELFSPYLNEQEWFIPIESIAVL